MRGLATPAVLMAVVLAQAPARAAAVPDISGPWLITGNTHALTNADGGPIPLLPAAQAQMEKNAAVFGKKGDPDDRCLPPGPTRTFMQAGFPFSIVQGSTMYGVMFQWNHLPRIIYMNQPHFESIGPEYFGQSIGHWEGKTLVVDTNGFNDATWLDDAGLPHSDQLTTTEHISLKDGGKMLEDRFTITDPATFSKPWDTVLDFKKAPPGTIVKEDYCLGRLGLAMSNVHK